MFKINTKIHFCCLEYNDLHAIIIEFGFMIANDFIEDTTFIVESMRIYIMLLIIGCCIVF